MDVRALSSTQEDHAASLPTMPAPRRRWLTRALLPLAVLLLTGALLAYAARDALVPATPVRVVRVVTKEGASASTVGATQGAAAVSLQAPGWVEPDPYPTYVTALTDGIVEKVLVLEGQRVEAGQVVAALVDDDARLAVARARAELKRQQAAQQAAQTDWENPVALERAAAVSQAMLAQAKAEAAQLNATIAQQEAKLRELQAAFDRVRKLSANAASKLEIEQAQFQVEAQRALVEATREARPILQAKVTRYEAEVLGADADLRLRVSLRQARDAAGAAVAEAQAALDEAKLRLERMKVVSPVSGVVMTRLAVPGTKVMLGMDSPYSAHIVHVYDPNCLQVRVDVPLADVAKVGAGQQARVVVDVLPDHAFAARVTRFVHQADIAKNTVEVKVAIDDPSPLLKPDMLARVKFLASHSGSEPAGSAPASGLTVYAPNSAIVVEGDAAIAWLLTPGDSRLRRQQVVLGVARGDGWVAVTEGLHPGDVLVAEPTHDLHDGQRVTIDGKTQPPS